MTPLQQKLMYILVAANIILLFINVYIVSNLWGDNLSIKGKFGGDEPVSFGHSDKELMFDDHGTGKLMGDFLRDKHDG